MAAELVEQDQPSSALALLHEHGVSEATAAAQVADLLLARNRVDEAVGVLRDCADTAQSPAERTLAARSLNFVLVEHERTDELRARGNAGDATAAELLIRLLIEQDRPTDVRAHVSSGGEYASDRIVRLLFEKGYVELAKSTVRNQPDRVRWPTAEPVVNELERQGRIAQAISLLRPFAEKEDHPEHRSSVVGRLVGLHVRQRDAAEAAAAYRLHPGSVSEYRAPKLIGLLLEDGRVEDAAYVLRDYPDAVDSYTAACLVDLMIAGPGPAADALSILRRRRDRRAVEHLADLQTEDRIELIRASADAAEALVDRMLAAGETDKALAALRVRSAAGDRRGATRLAALQQERAGDPQLRAIDLLMNTLYELRVGRDLDYPPYAIAEWERGRVPDPQGDADARLAAALREAGAAQSIPGGELPKPGHIKWPSDDRLYTETYLEHDWDGQNPPYDQLRTPGYHWDVRDENGMGAYFNATVSNRGEVEFQFLLERYPATPDGWRALMAAVNGFSRGNQHIRLWVSPYKNL